MVKKIRRKVYMLNRYSIVKPVILAVFSIALIANNANASTQRLPQLPKGEMEELSHKLLRYQEDYKPNKILKKQSADEINITLGKPESPNMSLLNSIDRTTTIYGREALSILLQNPLADLQKLQNRQLLVQRLKNSPELLQEFDTVLNKVASNQENVLLLWSLSNPFQQSLDLLAILGQLTGTNNSKFGLEAVRQVTLGSGLAISGFLVAANCSLWSDFLRDYYTESESYSSDSYHESHHSHYKIKSMPNIISPVLATAIGGIWAYKLAPAIIRQERISKDMQELMISVSQTLGAAQELQLLLLKVENAHQSMDYAKNLENYTQKVETLSKEVQKLSQELNSKTFKSGPSYLSFMGRVRYSYQLVAQIKDSLIPLLKSIGEVDAYVSQAKLINEHQNQPVHYCFTEFVKATDPLLKVTKSWNPVIKAEKLVTEDIALGNGQNLVPNILLTGPHGGGKSSFMKQLTYCVILSQVFGIAPADSCSMTLFSCINTYLDIRDNMEEGMSTFMAERERIDEIKKMIRRLSEERFGFTIVDELFKGTMEAEASRLVTKFMTRVEQVTESIVIMASHFVKPALEAETRENSRFKNFHMETVERTPGRFKRQFKLCEGRCDWWFDNYEKRERYVQWLQSVVV